MNWEAIGAVGEILGALAVLLSLLYLAVQIRQNTASIKSSTFQNAISSISQVSLGIATDDDSSRIAQATFEGEIGDLTERDRFRVGLLLTGLFRNYENFWFQYESGVMEEHVWRGVRSAMLGYYRLPNVQNWWNQRSSIFSPKFVEFLATLDEMERANDPEAGD